MSYLPRNFDEDNYFGEDVELAPFTKEQQVAHDQRKAEEDAIIQQSPAEVAGLTW